MTTKAMRTRADGALATAKRVWPVAKALGTLIALAIVAVIAVKALKDLPDRNLNWWLLAAATGAALVWWVLLAGGWSLLAAGHWTMPEVARWCRTQALRYLPGGIWAPVSRVAVVGGTALDRMSTVAAENLTALAAAATVGGAALALSGRWVWGLLVLTAPAPLILSRLTAERTRVAPERVLPATAHYLGAFVAYVGSAVLVQAAVSGWSSSLAVAGASGLAWAAGLVVVFAPSGIGARELAYVALLSGVLPKGDPAAGAVVARMVTVVAELLTLMVVARPNFGVNRVPPMVLTRPNDRNGGAPADPDPRG